MTERRGCDNMRPVYVPLRIPVEAVQWLSVYDLPEIYRLATAVSFLGVPGEPPSLRVGANEAQLTQVALGDWIVRPLTSDADCRVMTDGEFRSTYYREARK